MGKRVLILYTSMNRNGNSAILADEFARGAVESGHEVEKVYLADTSINFCKGCLACQRTKKCVIKDDANGIVESMLHADVLAFATPVYFYGMAGQMKTLLDRSNPMFTLDYQFRDIYLLASAADEDTSAIDGTITGLQGFIDCYGKSRLAGVVKGVGADAPGTIRNSPERLDEAYQMGLEV